ncbi:abortive infection system antitoxin AbiGi family protein [Chitinophagaceae bacterium LB-8]|uniref:Abortive infection system antitoxin AbiGi family protein n=1 Tax=Paraflavisolibacter caeni TaxID=2982496 RepID=A0A9X2XYZ6_9BACT|nr:abortive infection system antitoxin AbiGi family protein [Paraflavisolibacter caeni]MCU7551790.1 abortive infection system antitoxin AbiGi family protein [Paraflavisolibacter caeni]
MLKQVDHIFHFTTELNTLKEILNTGFKPSYARETLADSNVLVPMVSFSNILLRDVGNVEVLNYGEYAIGFEREWGIRNEFNPVVYTYKNGLLQNNLKSFLDNTVFLSFITEFRDKLKLFNSNGMKFSSHINLTNTTKEALDLLDYLTLNYKDELIDSISAHSRAIHLKNIQIFAITKQYKVKNVQDKEFIAYNDREWRKSYPELDILFEGEENYTHWINAPKPHFNNEPFLLKFSIKDVKAILVKNKEEIYEIVSELKSLHGDDLIDKLVSRRSLLIGTKETLEKNNF